MPTKEQLESALRNAHNAGDVAAAKKLATALKNNAQTTAETRQPSMSDPEKPLNPILGFGAEAMQGFNRGAMGLVDMASSLPNSALQIAGSDKRIPKVNDQPFMNQQFMDDGLMRDIARSGGEVAAMGLGGGALVRQGAQNLPGMVSNAESIGAGALRQMSAGTTAAKDISLGAMAGTGLEVGGSTGEAIAGPNGRAIGQLAGSMAMPLAPLGAKQAASGIMSRKNLQSAAPTLDQIKAQKTELYNAVDNSGVTIKQESLDLFSNRVIASMQKNGLNRRIHPKTTAAIKEMQALTQQPMTLTEMDTLRKVAQAAGKSLESDGKMGQTLVGKIDEYLDALSPSAMQGGSNPITALKQARSLHSRQMKIEMVDKAILDAQQAASGFENGLRGEFRSILKSPKKSRGLSGEEKEAMSKIVQGGKAENIAKHLGKFGFSEGQAGSMLLSTVGTGLAANAFGPAAVAVPLAGQMFRQVAQKLTRSNAEFASNIVKAGPNAKGIVDAYFKNTPTKARKVEELTALLLNGKANASNLRLSSNKLIADAAYFSSIAGSSADNLDSF